MPGAPPGPPTVPALLSRPGRREQNPLVTGHFDPLRKQLYQALLAYAQQRPETVGVRYAPMPPEAAEALGSYTGPDLPASTVPTHEIQLDPLSLRSAAGVYRPAPPTALQPQDTLVHELLHFLGYRLQPEVEGGLPPSARWALGAGNGQHRLIQYLLGSAGTPVTLNPAAVPRPLQIPPQGDAAQQEVWRRAIERLFATTPALQGPALQGLQRDP